MTNLSRKIDFKNIEGYTNEEQGEPIRQLRYVPNGQRISYMQDNIFYVYDFEREKVIEREDCPLDSWFEYRWQNSEKLYFIPADDKWEGNLYMCENLHAVPVCIASGIYGIVLGNKGEKIYGIWYTAGKYYGSGFELKHEIVEIDVQTGEKRILQELDSDNIILRGINDDFLFYVEKRLNKNLIKYIVWF